MDKTIVISADVINTINSLPQEDRIAMAATLAAEMICGQQAAENLNSMQRIIFAIIRSSVNRSTRRYAAAMSQPTLSA